MAAEEKNPGVGSLAYFVGRLDLGDVSRSEIKPTRSLRTDSKIYRNVILMDIKGLGRSRL